MKKKFLALLLAALMVVSLVPMTVFATGTSYAITNGTPKSAKETNHGYIAIDKTTAAEGETVTITVNPADGYQLKSLTATPVAPTISTIADVLATVEGFPKDIIENSSPTAPSDAWTNGTGSAFTYKNLALVLKSSSYMYAALTTGVTFDDTSKCYTATVSTLGTLKFNMTDGVLTSFEYTATNTKHEYDGTYAPASTPSAKLKPITPAKQTDGTYQFTMPAANVTVTAEFEEKAITIADILPDDFPTFSWPLPDNVWKNSVGSKMYINNNGLTFGGVSLYNILSKPVTKDENNYKYISNPYTITFVMDSDKLVKVITEGAENADNNGEYIPSHTHSFTYTVNGGKLTATCTAGCDKGYDTTPLTLTLTAPASLVYDGNAKAFTFADGEAAAWTGAGLELPKIYYYEKKDYPFYMGIDSAPTDAGGDYMVEITVNKKAARIYFTIDKATPYIKTNPEPTDIVYGKKLSDSTLFGGYVQVSSTNTTQVGGLFEWKLGDTIPALSDSETTEYDVTFTPADTNNYNTVSCKVKIKVTHTHNPVLVNGQAATETASGWKDYYKCDCGALFEDENGTTPIENLEAWKAQGGNGYIAPLVHSITPVNGKNATDTEAGYKPYYECKNCGKYYEDATGLIEISNIDEWKAEGGAGYLAPLHGTDNDHDHICDYCDRQVSECKDEDNDHKCDICKGQVSECKDEDNDHKCDICKCQVSECKDEDNDHKCDICKCQISEHKGVLVEGTAATLESAGFKSYYKCDCGKFFEDATCKVEITDLAKWKAQGGNGYIAKLEKQTDPTDPKSPETGDTSNMTLWLILMALSSMGLCACLVLGKKRKNVQ